MKKHHSNDKQDGFFSFEELWSCDHRSLFGKNTTAKPVTCLGMEFADDDARRAYFRERLREKLPELRHIEGFPIGSDDDIINLSDPPYYTACPNPWLNDFIAEWETEKQQLEAEGKRQADFEVTEPYAYPIREKKNNPLYVAHSYHTKVPPEVVLNYYLHYTQPGDIVIDNFAGTGMAGVAAKLCESPSAALQERVNNNWKGLFGHKPSWGRRFSILGDLSPIASNIAYNYNNYIDSLQFEEIANAIVKQLEDELGYTYDFIDENGNQGVINYVVWSEKQVCPNCGEVFTYWDQAVDIAKNIQRSSYQCPSCGNEITKRNSQKSFETHFDEVIGDSINEVAFEPVFVNYTVTNKRFERNLSEIERASMLSLIDSLSISSSPIKILEKGDKTSDPVAIGVNYLHQFYTKRNLAILLRFKSLIESADVDGRMKLYLNNWFTSCQSRLHRMNRYAPKHHRHVGPLANTLYISATPTEISPFYFIKSKIKENCVEIASANSVVNQIASATNVNIADESVDYIFTDPPFGANIMYSELNFILESWLGVRTNNATEAISNKTQNKGVFEYLQIMTDCFKEYYRILKPGKWMTVEFSNTSSSIWNAIQTSIQQAGFVITAVTDLDKGRGGLHGIVGVTAVDQDLAISCYKPSEKMLTNFTIETERNVWDFVGELLEHLPVHIEREQKTAAVVERSPKILFDRLISYYVQRGFPVPIDAGKFQSGLRERFVERDGMFFNPEQAARYDEMRKATSGFQPSLFFVDSEQGGIAWLNNELGKKPQTYQEIQPKWMQAIQGVRNGDILPELRQILEENFIEEKDGHWRCPNLQDDVDLIVLRHKSLMREFKVYVEAANKPKGKIKEARVEALRAGFKQCYVDKDFDTIVKVGDRIPANLLQEDEVLLQFYDIALTKANV